MVPCNDNIKTHRHKDGGKNGWMERGWKRERENLCQAMMIAVTLNRWNSAGILLLSCCNCRILKFSFAFSASTFRIFIIFRHTIVEFILFVSRGVWRCKYGNLGSSLTLPFLLSLFQIIKGGFGLLGSWQGSHLVSLPPAQAAGGVWTPCGGTSSGKSGRWNQTSPAS